MKKILVYLLVLCMLSSMLLFTSCAMVKNEAAPEGGINGGYSPIAPGADAGESMTGTPDFDVSADSDDPSPTPDKNVQDDEEKLPSGMITAGAHNDNTYYNDWLALFTQDEGRFGKFFSYPNPQYSWGYDSLSRVKVSVSAGETRVAGAEVTAFDSDGNKVFSAVTDAQGNAYLFPTVKEGSVTVTCGSESVTSAFSAQERELTVELSGAGNKLNVIEIMFVVDVTGSMGDEIRFLKAELSDVVDRIAANDSETVIKLAMLFYRDTDDAVPYEYYDFTDVTTQAGLFAQQEAINGQSANGGGDYPEAVDDALDMAVNKQWSTGATTKIIFHVLDAPAHSNDKNKVKLKNAVNIAAEKGIRLCPIICSGAAGVTEYTMREAAIYTGGTFIFVTDDSGIGGSHHDPDIPNATIELLNSMMVRLVKGYHTGEFDEPVYWKQDPNLGAAK